MKKKKAVKKKKNFLSRAVALKLLLSTGGARINNKEKSSVAALSLSVILFTGFSKNRRPGWFICIIALQ